MATRISCPSLDDIPVVELQHLPCTIHSNGKANIATYFEPTEEETNGNIRRSSTLRGRPLDGEIIPVPEGYVGIVTHEKQRPFSEDEDRNIEVSGKFNQITKWHFDSKYTSDSTLDGALKFFPKISAAVHAPVKADSSKTTT